MGRGVRKVFPSGILPSRHKALTGIDCQELGTRLCTTSPAFNQHLPTANQITSLSIKIGCYLVFSSYLYRRIKNSTGKISGLFVHWSVSNPVCTWGLSRSTWGQVSSYCFYNDLHVPCVLFSCCGLYQQATWVSRQRCSVPGRTGALDGLQDSRVRERWGDQQ